MTGMRRSLRAAVQGRSPTPPGPGCPPADDYWNAVQGHLPVDRRQALVDHAMVCAGCAAALRGAGDIARSAPGAVRPTGWGVRFLLPAVALGGAGLAIGALLLVVLLQPERRQAKPGAVFRAPDLPRVESLLAPESRLSRSGARLAWAGGPGGTVYTVTFTSARGEVLGQSRVEMPELVVPAVVLARLPGGEALIWTVEAQLPDGRRLDPRSFVQPVGE